MQINVLSVTALMLAVVSGQLSMNLRGGSLSQPQQATIATGRSNQSRTRLEDGTLLRLGQPRSGSLPVSRTGSNMGLSPLSSTALAGDGPAKSSAESQSSHAIPTRHEKQLIEGWTVLVDAQLLSGTNAAPGRQALAVLAHKLWEIRMVVAENRLAKLQKVRIYLDAHHALERMQYHPSSDWLREHGYDPAMAKAVHVPRAKLLVSRHSINEQPWAVLHELAHAYHDQVLGFDEPRVKAAWEKFKVAGKYKEPVSHISGQPRRHYALTDQKEFFAEMTESYFGTNDFFPFVRPELKAELPEVFALLEDIWGPLPHP